MPGSDTKKTEYILIIDNKPRITSVYIGERGRGKTLTEVGPYRSTIQRVRLPLKRTARPMALA
jgi:hypothetical protein